MVSNVQAQANGDAGMHGTRLLWLAAALIPFGAHAQEVGDARAGLTFAKQNCAECHAIREGEDASPNKKAPPFAKVAATSGMNGRALAVWLQTSHPTMPNLVLSPIDRDNVIAYIVSLAPVPPQ
jgi:mono/diheme cytochrome c family protein